MFRTIREQIDTVFREDPAARSVIEILVCYPGLHAILLHRLAHKLWKWKVPLAPRMISQLSRLFTGIDPDVARMHRAFATALAAREKGTNEAT